MKFNRKQSLLRWESDRSPNFVFNACMPWSTMNASYQQCIDLISISSDAQISLWVQQTRTTTQSLDITQYRALCNRYSSKYRTQLLVSSVRSSHTSASTRPSPGHAFLAACSPHSPTCHPVDPIDPGKPLGRSHQSHKPASVVNSRCLRGSRAIPVQFRGWIWSFRCWNSDNPPNPVPTASFPSTGKNSPPILPRRATLVKGEERAERSPRWGEKSVDSRNLTPPSRGIKVRRSRGGRGSDSVPAKVCRRCIKFLLEIGRAYDAWSRNAAPAHGFLAASRPRDDTRRRVGLGLLPARPWERNCSTNGPKCHSRPRNIALFRSGANGYCGPFTGRQAAR